VAFDTRAALAREAVIKLADEVGGWMAMDPDPGDAWATLFGVAARV
jgi:hypothetical protein